ncbi:hypothetical protein ACFLSJ_07660 [Verrucomicrobiota bacterium]
MSQSKVPFRVLFSDDTTNILTCESPFHKKGEPFHPDMLRAVVDETAGTGIEVHMLQPGVGAVPLWKSTHYPDHAEWFQQTYGKKLDSFSQYVADGGDMVLDFVERCREKGLVPFISLRLNDGHHLEYAERFDEGIRHSSLSLFRFYNEHPEYRIGSDPNNWDQHVLNWAEPEVRDYKFGFIRELCENYDIDGFELDFMRHTSFFRLDETTPEERVEIMTGFVRRVREVLDRTAKPDRRRWLCVRVPAFLAAHDRLGVDLRQWVDAGVDMVNLSYFYFTEQQGDYAEIRRMVPDATLYVEMCHTTHTGKIVVKGASYDNFTYRRTTPLQYYTTAHLAYARGLNGISAFNFVYYRSHGGEERGPFDEPPFNVFQHLGDPDWLARQPQHYVLGETWEGRKWGRNRGIAEVVEPGQTVTFVLDMAPPSAGWQDSGRLRIQAQSDLGDSRWICAFNGLELAETEDRSEPYENSYSPLLGGPEHHRAWVVPRDHMQDGHNTVEVILDEGQPAKLVFVDLAAQ